MISDLIMTVFHVVENCPIEINTQMMLVLNDDTKPLHLFINQVGLRFNAVFTRSSH